jgi:formylglycine-generating enzyme required for sulfatase activity
MVQIAAGSFIMGQASGDPTAAPARTVSVRRFALAQRPVTMAEWKACVAAGGCAAVRLTEGDERTSMHNLSWDDGQQYVAWLSKKTGHRYRLPTEAEWEYAARASTVTRYWWGDQVGVGLANCSDCGGEQDKSGPLPVDAFKPNPFGLLAIHGGVSQWVADCWFPNYQGAPTDGSARDRKNCNAASCAADPFATIATTSPCRCETTTTRRCATSATAFGWRPTCSKPASVQV